MFPSVKDYQKIQVAWPDTVPIRSRCSRDDLTHFPITLKWIQTDMANNTSVIPLWWKCHEKVLTYLISHHTWSSTPESYVFLYNLVWAVLGYQEGQPDNVQRLARSIKRDRSFRFTSIELWAKF